MIKAIKPLGKHDRAAFSCGVASLDDWFHLRAGQDEKRNVARVFVAIDDERGIVGFYSLSSFTLAIADLPPNMQNVCQAMTSFHLPSLGVSRAIRKFAAKVSAIFCLPTQFVG